jgi:hypothetical protein
MTRRLNDLDRPDGGAPTLAAGHPSPGRCMNYRSRLSRSSEPHNAKGFWNLEGVHMGVYQAMTGRLAKAGRARLYVFVSE